MFRKHTAELHLQMFGIALSALCADVVFPWENNRAADSRPYAYVPHRNRCIICGWLKTFAFVGAVPPNYRRKNFILIEMWFAFSADNSSPKLKRICEVLRDLLY